MAGHRCCAAVQYESYSSRRKLPNGEARYSAGDGCQNIAGFIDRYGDHWCWLHVRNPNTIREYGPFTRIAKEKP